MKIVKGGGQKKREKVKEGNTRRNEKTEKINKEGTKVRGGDGIEINKESC